MKNAKNPNSMTLYLILQLITHTHNLFPSKNASPSTDLLLHAISSIFCQGYFFKTGSESSGFYANRRGLCGLHRDSCHLGVV